MAWLFAGGCTTNPGNVGEVDDTAGDASDSEAGPDDAIEWELPLDFRVTDVASFGSDVVAVGFRPAEDGGNATWVVLRVDASGAPVWTHETEGIPTSVAASANGIVVAGRSHVDWDEALMQLEFLDPDGNVELNVTEDPGEFVDVAVGSSLLDGSLQLVAIGNAQETAPGGAGPRLRAWDLEGEVVWSVDEAPDSLDAPFERVRCIVPQLHSGWMVVIEDQAGMSYRASYDGGDTSEPAEPPFVSPLGHRVEDMGWVIHPDAGAADAAGDDQVGVMTVGDGAAVDIFGPWTELADTQYRAMGARPGVVAVGGHQIVGDDSAQAVLRIVDPFTETITRELLRPQDPWSSFDGVAVTSDGLVVGGLAADSSALVALLP